jgi:hypothetical protein
MSSSLMGEKILSKGEHSFRACSVVFNPYGLEGIDTDWKIF